MSEKKEEAWAIWRELPEDREDGFYSSTGLRIFRKYADAVANYDNLQRSRLAGWEYTIVRVRVEVIDE